MVIPMGNRSPGLWVDVRVCTPKLSEAVGSGQDTDAVVLPPTAVKNWLLVGQSIITGFSVSIE